MGFDTKDPAYVFAYNDAVRGLARLPGPSVRSRTKTVLYRFRNSAEFRTLQPRTQADYEKYLAPFEKEFGEDPIRMFEEKGSLAEISDWKNR
ncbi:MAG: hypothetical protein KGN33_18890 [Paracoccaceae bacterium]|nr:hypothetical protein [Paracoccaceae bacterium]